MFAMAMTLSLLAITFTGSVPYKKKSNVLAVHRNPIVPLDHLLQKNLI
jgi:hypothetical protein